MRYPFTTFEPNPTGGYYNRLGPPGQNRNQDRSPRQICVPTSCFKNLYDSAKMPWLGDKLKLDVSRE
jgi:hypothetical protein